MDVEIFLYISLVLNTIMVVLFSIATAANIKFPAYVPLMWSIISLAAHVELVTKL